MLRTVLLLLLGASTAHAQDSGADPAVSLQYDFLVGDWDVTVTMPRAGRPALVYGATWRIRWVADGRVLMQEWSDPYGSGVELRAFNATTRRWDGRNLYAPDPGTWYANEAELQGGVMVVTTPRQAADGTTILSREIYRPVETDRFEVSTEVSLDAGASWRSGRYGLVARRRRR
ncbi:MAG: hypothetical protein KA761_06495 [Gemmatimonadaceae bacterium]|nr:hypothetical protein [Gemmatimonadaceae bacterium]